MIIKILKAISLFILLLILCFCFIVAVVSFFLDVKSFDQAAKLTETTIQYCKKKNDYNKNVDYKKICSIILTNSLYFNLDPKLVVAIVYCESKFDAKAVRTNKNESIDYGLMQINTIWNGHFFKEEAFHNIMFKPEYNIYAGCYIISQNIKLAKGDLYKAIKRYNGSGARAEEYARKIINTYYEICKESDTQNGGLLVWKK